MKLILFSFIFATLTLVQFTQAEPGVNHFLNRKADQSDSNNIDKGKAVRLRKVSSKQNKVTRFNKDMNGYDSRTKQFLIASMGVNFNGEMVKRLQNALNAPAEIADTTSINKFKAEIQKRITPYKKALKAAVSKAAKKSRSNSAITLDSFVSQRQGTYTKYGKVLAPESQASLQSSLVLNQKAKAQVITDYNSNHKMNTKRANEYARAAVNVIITSTNLALVGSGQPAQSADSAQDATDQSQSPSDGSDQAQSPSDGSDQSQSSSDGSDQSQ